RRAPRCGSPDRGSPRPSRRGRPREVDRLSLRPEGESPPEGFGEAGTGQLDAPEQRHEAAREAPRRRRQREPEREPPGPGPERDLLSRDDLDVDRAEAFGVPEEGERRRAGSRVPFPADLALEGLPGADGVAREVDPDHAGAASTRIATTARGPHH